MRILLTGGGGFIGSRLRRALLQAGHELVCAGRHAVADELHCRWVVADFAHPRDTPWVELLAGVDAVVNAVGIFREQGTARFDDLHVRGPAALFEACVRAGVRRVVQVSALGADAQSATAYHRSKWQADEHLLSLPLDATVVQPSLVFGAEGVSSRRLMTMAALPLLALPDGGRQPIQPVHVDDVVAALVALLAAPPGRWRGRRVPLVGPRPLLLVDYLQGLRRGMALAEAPTVTVPRSVVAVAARIGDHLPDAMLDRASWQMLQRGNTAEPDDIVTLLGEPPRPVHRFVSPPHADALRVQAQMGWLQPVLRLSLAAVWILTGIVSLGLYPVEESYRLLDRAGVAPALQPFALFGAAVLDLALGVLTLWPMARRRRLWAAQALLIAGYTLVISVRLPEFWLHPYGPLVKNLPMLAVLWLLWIWDRPAPGPADG